MPVPAAMRLEKFFEATSDCQFYVKRGADGTFRYVHVNPAALSVTGGKSESEILGLTPSQALGEDYGSSVERNIEAAFESGQPYHFRGPLGRDGRPPIYDAFYFPLRDDEGNVAGILGSARDISEINALAERAAHNGKLEALGAIAAGLIHDFNNILAIFQATLQAMERPEISAERRAMILQEGSRTLSNGKALTHRLAAFARRERVQVVPLDMERTLKECRPVVQRILGRSINLRLEIEEDLWMACCDRSEFEVALMNLATNARDALDGLGAVIISAVNETRREGDPADRPEHAVRITFQDNGCGMDADTAAKSIDPFFTTKPEGRGTGLGLSGVASFANAIGGSMIVESEVGVGTSVSVLFPKAEN